MASPLLLILQLMIAIYLIYGFCFFALAVALSFQIRANFGPLSRRSTLLLTLFALLHGSFEWSKALEILKSSINVPIPASTIQSLQVLLLAGSFSFLFGFGLDLLAEEKPWPKYLKMILIADVLCFVGISGGYFFFGRGENTSMPHVIESFSRYFIAFPGALITARGLFRSASRHDSIYGSKIGYYLKGAAYVFLVYALAAGLFQLGIPIKEPMRFLHFNALFVISLRATCALLLGYLLSEAFVMEVLNIQKLERRLRMEFTTLITHDVRSAISGALSGDELLDTLIQSDSQKEKQLKLSRLIKENLGTANTIVNDLFDASLLEIQKLPQKKKIFDIKELCERMFEDYRNKKSRRKFTFKAEDGPLQVYADPQRIRQIFDNLISNAINYSPVGSEVTLELQRKNPKRISIFVTNQGKGISPKEMPHLFDRFYRAHSGAGRAGTGLGLYIVKGLVEANGGQVSVESKSGQPTLFEVQFPDAA